MEQKKILLTVDRECFRDSDREFDRVADRLRDLYYSLHKKPETPQEISDWVKSQLRVNGKPYRE